MEMYPAADINKDRLCNSQDFELAKVGLRVVFSNV